MTTMTTRKDTGFTLIEIITVLLILSIISVIAVTRLMSTGTQLIAAADVVKTHLRYAQSRAMSDNKIWGISCDGTNYWLFNDGNINSKQRLPGEKNDTVDITASEPEDTKWQYVSSIEAFTISFDDWGIPYTTASAADGSELTSDHASSEITIFSQGNNATITITQNTGFIP